VLSGAIIAAIAFLIVLFFVKSGQDELRLNATWVCNTANCGNLQQMIFKKITPTSGDYDYVTKDNSVVKGTWTINKKEKTLYLRPGILQATNGLTNFSEEAYKYKLDRNTLTLTRFENGAVTGNDITLVKQP
jgi:hypothetical protein